MTHSAIALSRRVVLAALLVAPVAAQSAPATPEDVVRRLLDAMSANDAESIRTAFAVDASQAYGDRTPRSGDAFRDWLESDIIAVHGRVENAAFAVDGDAVVVTGTYRNDNGYSSDADFLMRVRDGLIVSWQIR